MVLVHMVCEVYFNENGDLINGYINTVDGYYCNHGEYDLIRAYISAIYDLGITKKQRGIHVHGTMIMLTLRGHKYIRPVCNTLIPFITVMMLFNSINILTVDNVLARSGIQTG